jgi:serine/threonine-protein kinase RsbT
MRIAFQADVEQIRREARLIAMRAGFAHAEAEAVVLAVSELATNLVHYARGGQLSIMIISRAGVAGISILSRDGGPGIKNIELALQDGYSTGGGLGSGLPAVHRLMDEFAITTGPTGTRIEARKWVTRQSPST